MVASREAKAFRDCLTNAERGPSGPRFRLRGWKAWPMVWYRPYCAPYSFAGPKSLWGRRSNALEQGRCCHSCPCRPAGPGTGRLRPLPGASALQGLWLQGRARLQVECDRQVRGVQGAHGRLRKSSDAQMHIRECTRNRTEPGMRACRARRTTRLKDRAAGVREKARAALVLPVWANAWRRR